MEYRLIAILLFSLVILLLIGIFLIWYRINKNRARLAKETQEATSSLVKNFEILREEIQKQINNLGKRERVSAKDKQSYFKLKEALDISERYIGKEIKDIEKELK